MILLLCFDVHSLPIGLQTKENVAQRGKFRLVESGLYSVPRNFYTREHFDYNLSSFTRIAIDCSASSGCNDRRHASSFVSSDMVNLNQRDMAKQLPTHFVTHCMHEFFTENYGCGLFKVSSQSRKFEFSVFSIIQLNGHSF